MKQSILVFATFFLGILAHAQTPPTVFASQPYTKSITNPYIERKETRDLFISKIETSETFTVVSFVFKNTTGQSTQISLNPENFYILANGLKFPILDVKEIKREPTVIEPGRIHNFFVYFKPLPSNATKFDIIEDNGNFDLYGISMQSSPPNVALTRFTKDFNYGRLLRGNQWAVEEKANNTFVFNINNKGDIVRITNTGIIIPLHLISVTKGSEGANTFQFVNTTNDQGQPVNLRIYDNESLGIVAFLPDGIVVQFFKK